MNSSSLKHVKQQIKVQLKQYSEYWAFSLCTLSGILNYGQSTKIQSFLVLYTIARILQNLSEAIFDIINKIMHLKPFFFFVALRISHQATGVTFYDCFSLAKLMAPPPPIQQYIKPDAKLCKNVD
jgi:hypothetical protein